MTIGRQRYLLELLLLLLLCSSLVFLSPSSSNAAEGDETRTTVSETTEIENLGSGLEQHTTTTVEDVVTEGAQETTTNYLTNPGFQTGNTDGWDKSGNVNVCATCGPFGGKALQTGPETAGGTVSQTVDLFDKMIKEEINEGFTINYGAHVFSHQSNATVPACDSNPANGPDCRDSFSITLDIKDSSGTLLHKFEHEFNEITFTGWNTTDFFFNSQVPENTYTSAFATLELFGIDSGFPNGFFGPAFDNATITATHTNFIVEQITTITEELIQTAIETIEDTTTIETTDVAEVETTIEPEVVESFEITVSDNFGETIDNFEISVDNNMEITIEPIGPEPTAAEVEIETTVAEVETQIEAEVETQVAEVSTEAEPEPEPQPTETTENDTGDPEPTDTASNEADEPQEESGSDESNESDSKPKSESKPKAKSEVRKAKSESKEQRKKAIATRVVTKIISKLGTDAASQATQLALMNAIGANLSAAAPNLQDASTWYASSQLPDNAISDPSAVLFSSAQDSIMNGLVNSQYK
tara:strand:+ start:115 stop:1701 length:1587 start_codon:yes stop_codon:yes gene_type:complete